MVRRLPTVVLFFGLAAAVSARDIHVNNVTGDDRRDGSSATVAGASGGPCRTIGRALQLVRAEDRVILAKTDQPYRESITLQAGRHSGVPGKPFELLGNGAILDGTQPVSRTSWEHFRGPVYRFQPPRLSHSMLYLGPKPAVRRPAPVGAGLPALESLEWCLYERHVYFRAEPNKLPTDYELSSTHLPVGVTIYEARHIVMRDLIVQGFQLDGLNAHDGVVGLTLAGITSRGNGRSGLSVGGACRVKAEDCLIGDNGVAQVRTEGTCHLNLVRCDLLENTAPALVKDGGQVVFAETK